MDQKIAVFYVPSTHWDREWYQEFQGFRYRLVKLVDKLLDILDREPGYGPFTFDGQTVCLEDYLEIRPERREKLAGYIQCGRIVVGPWYTMPDERLLSGESLIRNLLEGHQVARSFHGQAMKYGYLCDIFGHVAQMPQILCRSGIAAALLGRGTNENTHAAHFRWHSPDGSMVTTFTLPEADGYGMATRLHDAAATTEDPRQWREKVIAEAEKIFRQERDRSPLPLQLWMDGIDHLEPTARMVPALQVLAEVLPKVEIKFSTLPEFAAAVAAYQDQLPVFDGEIVKTAEKLGGGYLYLISHCLSSHYPLKHANDQCQNLLEKWAEPCYVLAQASGQAPAPGYLRLAWRYLLKNQAHDSICGCSIDQVHKDMHYRFDQTRTICDNLLKDLFPEEDIGKDNSGAALMLFSNLPFKRRTVVTAEIPSTAVTSHFSLVGFADDQVPCFILRDAVGNPVPYQLENYRTPLSLQDHATPGKRRIRFRFETEFTGVGNRSFTIEPSPGPVRDLETMLTAPLTAENEFLRVTVNGDGTVDLTDLASGRTYAKLLLFEDTAEMGDGWFHVPPVDNATFYSSGGPAEIAVVADGALAVSFRIEKTMRLPPALDWTLLQRSADRREFKIATTVTLKHGTPRLECQVAIKNNVADHRLRVLLPTGVVGDDYFAAQPFAVVTRKRGLDRATHNWKESDAEERSFLNFSGVTDARGGLALLAGDGLHEIAVKDDAAGTMALTLFRSFKRTVRTTGETGGQLLGQTMAFHFALQPFSGAADYRALIQATEDFTQAVRHVCRKRADADQTLFHLVEGKVMLSALKPAADNSGAAVLRLYNMSPKPVEDRAVFATTIAMVREIDLMEERPGRKVATTANEFAIALSPWQIATYRIDWKV
jgi:alpha-mannosidase